jgi:hypothetical protein
MFSYRNNNFTPILITKNRRIDNTPVILFTNARDEPNIAEWVAHHLLLGFDKVVIFDHLSKNPIDKIIGNDFNGKLEVLRVDGGGNIKLDLMNRAVDIATNKNYSWMLYLDADEFLYLRNKNVQQYLDIFRDADAIGINWLLFGTSGYKQQPKGLLTENFVRSELMLNSHIKSFVRPSCVTKIVNPHYYMIYDRTRYYSGTGTQMKMGPFSVQMIPFTKSSCYIAHYYTQSEEEHLRRKSRQLDDGSVGKNNMLEDIHKQYNNVINIQMKRDFSAKTKELLLKYGIEL